MCPNSMLHNNCIHYVLYLYRLLFSTYYETFEWHCQLSSTKRKQNIFLIVFIICLSRTCNLNFLQLWVEPPFSLHLDNNVHQLEIMENECVVWICYHSCNRKGSLNLILLAFVLFMLELFVWDIWHFQCTTSALLLIDRMKQLNSRAFGFTHQTQEYWMNLGWIS